MNNIARSFVLRVFFANIYSMTLSHILPLIPKSTEAIIFDLDGTLADTMPLHFEAWNKMGKVYGVEITEDMIQALAGMPSYQTIQVLNKQNGWDLDPAEGRETKNTIYHQIIDGLDKINSIKPVMEVAQYFLGKLPLAVGTGSTRKNAHRVIDNIEVRGMLNVIVTASDVSNHKPAPDTFLECARMMRISVENCLVFEDGPMGFEAAINAGMPVVCLPDYTIKFP